MGSGSGKDDGPKLTAGGGGRTVAGPTGGAPGMGGVAAVTSGGPAVTSGRTWAEFAVSAVLMLAVGVITALSRRADMAHAGRTEALWIILLEDALSVVVLIALLPGVRLFERRFPLGVGPLWRWIAPHALATVPFSLVHVVGMGVLRWAVFGALGRPRSAFGPVTDFPYEYRKDVLTYGALLLLIWMLRTLRAQAAGPPPQAARADQPIEVRDGARRFFVRPAEIVWVEAAGNYAELNLAGRAILHRASLASLEARLADDGFVRIHRQRLVNRAEIASLQANAAGDFTVTLRDGRTLAGSRRYRAALSPASAA